MKQFNVSCVLFLLQFHLLAPWRMDWRSEEVKRRPSRWSWRRVLLMAWCGDDITRRLPPAPPRQEDRTVAGQQEDGLGSTVSGEVTERVSVPQWSRARQGGAGLMAKKSWPLFLSLSFLPHS